MEPGVAAHAIIIVIPGIDATMGNFGLAIFTSTPWRRRIIIQGPYKPLLSIQSFRYRRGVQNPSVLFSKSIYSKLLSGQFPNRYTFGAEQHRSIFRNHFYVDIKWHYCHYDTSVTWFGAQYEGGAISPWIGKPWLFFAGMTALTEKEAAALQRDGEPMKLGPSIAPLESTYEGS